MGCMCIHGCKSKPIRLPPSLLPPAPPRLANMLVTANGDTIGQSIIQLARETGNRIAVTPYKKGCVTFSIDNLDP